jgi:predicted metal-dependent hydrolase
LATGTIQIEELSIELQRKRIKNLHLRVYPPDGRICLSAPLRADEKAIRRFALSKLDWLRDKRRSMLASPAMAPPCFTEGERHYYQGEAHPLALIEGFQRASLRLREDGALEMRLRAGSTEAGRGRLLDAWYRERLQELIPPLLARWQKELGLRAPSWSLRKMRGRWGSCNPRDARIIFSLSLARVAPQCLEYVIVHELIHLLEPSHGKRFYDLLERHYPGWKAARRLLRDWPGAQASALS